MEAPPPADQQNPSGEELEQENQKQAETMEVEATNAAQEPMDEEMPATNAEGVNAEEAAAAQQEENANERNQESMPLGTNQEELNAAAEANENQSMPEANAQQEKETTKPANNNAEETRPIATFVQPAVPPAPTTEHANTILAPPPPPPAAAPKIVPRFVDEEDAKWHTVGIFQGVNATVSNFIDNNIWTSSGMNINSENLPDLSSFQRMNLEPGTAYRFRLRAINSVGAGEWSEVSSFKTCLPGFPGAPSAIKISKSSEGAHLTWEPPPSCLSSNEVVEEYSVYLAVKPGKDKDGKLGGRTPAQLAFVRVYVGAANQCTVSHSSLAAAHVDCSNKPAIIFRIAARNEKGYGPATQVRWLQDTTATNTNNMGRNKPEITGASPSKRFKTAAGRSIGGD